LIKKEESKRESEKRKKEERNKREEMVKEGKDRNGERGNIFILMPLSGHACKSLLDIYGKVMF
jgi:hypothetical protein